MAYPPTHGTGTRTTRASGARDGRVRHEDLKDGAARTQTPQVFKKRRSGTRRPRAPALPASLETIPTRSTRSNDAIARDECGGERDDVRVTYNTVVCTLIVPGGQLKTLLPANGRAAVPKIETLATDVQEREREEGQIGEAADAAVTETRHLVKTVMNDTLVGRQTSDALIDFYHRLEPLRMHPPYDAAYA